MRSILVPLILVLVPEVGSAFEDESTKGDGKKVQIVVHGLRLKRAVPPEQLKKLALANAREMLLKHVHGFHFELLHDGTSKLSRSTASGEIETEKSELLAERTLVLGKTDLYDIEVRFTLAEASAVLMRENRKNTTSHAFEVIWTTKDGSPAFLLQHCIRKALEKHFVAEIKDGEPFTTRCFLEGKVTLSPGKDGKSVRVDFSLRVRAEITHHSGHSYSGHLGPAEPAEILNRTGLCLPGIGLGGDQSVRTNLPPNLSARTASYFCADPKAAPAGLTWVEFTRRSSRPKTQDTRDRSSGDPGDDYRDDHCGWKRGFREAG